MEMIGQLGAVGAVLALLGASLWGLRRRGFAAVLPPRTGRLMKSLERLPLGPQHTLHLIRLGEEALVVGCSPAGCTLLAQVALHRIDSGETKSAARNRDAAPELQS